MKIRYIYTVLIFIFLNFSLLAQEDEKVRNWNLNGYITNMQSFMFDSIDKDWVNDNLVHNRLNFRWYPHKTISFGIDARTRIFTGETLKYFDGYSDMIERDNGLIDLNFNIIDEKSILINSLIDRAWLTFEKGNLNITAGRQRINWGRSFVWNPNDIFNSYSFFDFDYPEKPGSDAVRIQYYTGPASSLELVAKADSTKYVSVGGLYKFNVGTYDIQVLGGIIQQQDYVIGLGWEGNLKNISFRGEMSYLHSKENFDDTTGIFVATVGFDYAFQNSLMFRLEYLYNQQPKSGGISNFSDYYYKPLSVKTLSFVEHSIFGSVSYPITPLFNAGLSGMYYPQIEGYYVGPDFSYSLNDNIDFSFIVQTFGGKLKDQTTGERIKQSQTIAFLRLKINF
ncbi:MAG: hypothetical protein GY756_10990 [bacterium]|nr:hypothetical protein [bacterium]